MTFEDLLSELDAPFSCDEFEEIISSITQQNPISDILFKGKYQVLLLKNIFPWKTPLCEQFETIYAICGAKLPETIDPSESEFVSADTYDGAPMSVVFDSLISQDKSVNDLIKEKFVLYPLSPRIVKKIILLCNTINQKKAFKYPVIAIGYNKDPKSLYIQGCYRTENKKNVRLLVSNQGTLTGCNQLPKYTSVECSHLAGFEPNTPVLSNVFAHFDILGWKNETSNSPSKHMKVEIECLWDYVNKLLQHPVEDATYFAKVQVVEGDESTGVFMKFNEVKLIMALQKSLQTGIMTWPTATSCDIMSKLENFMKAEMSTLSRMEKAEPINTKHFEWALMNERKNLDFTDKLWLILKDCSSSEELITALSFIYSKLKEFVEPPFVHRKNVSKIALLVKSMRTKTVICPVIDSQQAIEMLLEIGVEKLRRDYFTLFCGFELAHFDLLEYYIQPSILSAEAVMRLRMLHVVLELSFICFKCLNLPKILLSVFIRYCLKYYSSVDDIDLKHVFRFQIPSTVALPLLQQMRPTLWGLSLTSSDSNYRKHTILWFSMTSTEEHIFATKGRDPSVSLDGATYACLKSSLVEDNFS